MKNFQHIFTLNYVNKYVSRKMSLLSASAEGDLTTLTRCLEEGDHIELRDKLGRSALHTAAQHNRIEVIEYLISNKANIEALDSSSPCFK